MEHAHAIEQQYINIGFDKGSLNNLPLPGILVS